MGFRLPVPSIELWSSVHIDRFRQSHHTRLITGSTPFLLYTKRDEGKQGKKQERMTNYFDFSIHHHIEKSHGRLSIIFIMEKLNLFYKRLRVQYLMLRFNLPNLSNFHTFFLMYKFQTNLLAFKFEMTLRKSKK